MTQADERFMARAIELARSAPRPSPNPRVGAVVVRDNRILSEARHDGPGTAHAEAAALEGVDADGTTVYVTLEPCVHRGRTAPCAPSLAAAGVSRVVAAMEDPDARMRGRGLRLLRERGVEVTVGTLEREARALVSAYEHQRRTGRTRIALKLALSLDGYLAAADRTARWITGAQARAEVHARRAEADALLVGSGTVTADDPLLTARLDAEVSQPARLIVDSSGRVPADSRVFHSAGEVLVATTQRCPHETQTAWKEAGAEVLVLPSSPEGVDLAALAEEASRRGWLELYCEGGARLAASLLRAGLVDRLELYYGSILLGGGPRLDGLGVGSMNEAHRLRPQQLRLLGDDVVVILDRIDG